MKISPILVFSGAVILTTDAAMYDWCDAHGIKIEDKNLANKLEKDTENCKANQVNSADFILCCKGVVENYSNKLTKKLEKKLNEACDEGWPKNKGKIMAIMRDSGTPEMGRRCRDSCEKALQECMEKNTSNKDFVKCARQEMNKLVDEGMMKQKTADKVIAACRRSNVGKKMLRGMAEEDEDTTKEDSNEDEHDEDE